MRSSVIKIRVVLKGPTRQHQKPKSYGHTADTPLAHAIQYHMVGEQARANE